MTNLTLDKIDLVRERTGASYQQAVELLNENDGNVVEAIIAFERSNHVNGKIEQIEVSGNKLVEKIKKLLHEGNITKLTIKREGEVILNIPVNFGIAAVVLSPFLSVIAGIAAVASSCTIVIERGNK
jgi:adenine-specific DNA methylase